MKLRIKVVYDFKKKFTFWVVVLLLFGLLPWSPPNIFCQNTGFKYFKNYSYMEYDHHPQNWGMAQAKNGIIYVANQAGVLEFDGVSWRVIGIPTYSTVRSLAIDENGTVYIGGIGEIGYLKADEKGVLQYVSLMDRLEENKRNFTDVWRTVATKEEIYFSTFEFLFRWDLKRKQMKTWKSTHRFLYPFIVEGELFIHQQKVGLMQMVNDSLKLLPGGEIFTEAAGTIFMIVPYDAGNNSQTLLIGTRLKGFFLYDGKSMMPFSTEVDDYLRDKIASHGVRLLGGDFALATRRGGLVAMDPHGRLKYIFDKNYGLQDDTVYYVFEDIGGNLWICLSKGISKIEYSSPISIYDERANLSGLVLSVVKHHSKLYVGTVNGVYYLESPFKFHLIPGISSSCWNLCSVDDSLFAATSEGVFHIKKDILEIVIDDSSFVLLPSLYNPSRIWCGTKNGLVVLLRESGKWKEEYRIENINQEIRSLVEDKKGNIWAGTLTGSVFKLDFVDDVKDVIVNKYDISHGLPDGDIYVSWAAGHIIFATQRGIFRFDEKKKKFIPDDTLGAGFSGGPGSKPISRLVEDKNKNIWFHSQSRNYYAIPATGESFTVSSRPLLRIPMSQVNSIYPDPDGKVIWFAGFDGIIRYDTTVKKNYQQDFKTFIRTVRVNDSRIFYGYEHNTGKAAKDLIPILGYKARNIYFDFAAPYFEAETETQYQYILEGYDKDWSAWSKIPHRNYINLDPGLYTFRVRAKNIYGHFGTDDVFQFKILLPWYSTWWAFLSYASLLFILMYLIVKWQRSIRLEKEKQRLELIVRERTKEIAGKNQQLEEQTLRLKEQSEKLKEMDQLKSRFFANISHEFRTPLTLIMSPLEQMFSENRDKEQKKKLKMMLRSSQRLLTLINQLLDLSRFDSGKVKLQAARQNIIPFLKGTVASFHLVAIEQQLELMFYTEEEEIQLYFDAPKMEEVMYNLLINAIKFTPPGGKITVSVTVEKIQHDNSKESVGYVNISVQDTGFGISQEQLAHIFDRFYQAEGLKGRDHKGTGIGLALTKEIVLLHRGIINVHSQEGKGTEFVIQLPMGRDHLKPGEILSTSEDASGRVKCKEIEILHVTKGLEEEEDNRDTGEVEPMGKVETDVHGNEKHPQEKNIILVVEDEPDVREFIRAPLEPLYTVIEASDGQEGIAKAKEIIPDLIVSDIMMPEIDGYELCRVLKNDINTSHIPVILLTAKASEKSIIQGLESGADDYITKPFNTRMLLNRIKNLIDLRRQLQLKIQRKKMLLPTEISVSSPDEQFLNKLQGIIEKNLSDPDFNVDELSKKLYMGRSTLFRKIQALTGETTNQFILSYRLERGAQLLREKFGNVTEVAFEVGFSSAAYFSKLFKEKFHQTPAEFQATAGP